jgi:hypothetical protein
MAALGVACDFNEGNLWTLCVILNISGGGGEYDAYCTCLKGDLLRCFGRWWLMSERVLLWIWEHDHSQFGVMSTHK